jgi:hypothetical protein
MAKASTKKAVVTSKRVSPKKVAPKKVAPKKSVKAKAVATKIADVPILMKATNSKPKKSRFKKSNIMSPLEVLFRINSLSAVGLAFINALNGGLVVISMLLMMMAFVTELFIIVVRDYSEANKKIIKYKNLIKDKVKRK